MTQTVPTVFIRTLAGDRIAVRFASIGNRWRFNTILQRLRFDFPLINCAEIEGQPWWVITRSQREQLEEFSARNGLQIVEFRREGAELAYDRTQMQGNDSSGRRQEWVKSRRGITVEQRPETGGRIGH